MSDKKKLFGVESEWKEDINGRGQQEKQRQFNVEEEKESTSGMHVKEMKEQTATFGARYEDASKSKQGKLDNVKMVFSLQNKLFWVNAYILAIIYLFLMNRSIFQTQFPYILDIVNTMLFPFSAIVIGSIALRFRNFIPGVYYWLYPTYKKNNHIQSILFLIIWYVTKIIFYYVIWMTSFFWGVLGLLLTAKNARKIEK